jgi:ABC-type spermidine/putrescine transport system permease subunit I
MADSSGEPELAGGSVKRFVPLLLAGPALVLLCALLAGPLVLLARVSLYEPATGRGFYTPGTWTASNFVRLPGDDDFRSIAAFSVGIGLVLTLLTLTVAYPLALFIHSLNGWRRTAAVTAVLVPKLANVLVIIYGLQFLLSSAGPINRVLLGLGILHEPVMLYRNRVGMVIGEVYLLLPYAILVLLAGLSRIDPSLAQAARGLGASRWQSFRRVIWPLSLPALAAAGQLVLVWALAALLGPLFLGSPRETTLAVEIERQALEYGAWPRAAATAVLLVGTIAACSLLAAWPARAARERAP